MMEGGVTRRDLAWCGGLRFANPPYSAQRLRLREMPGAVQKAVAVDVAGLGVLGEGVERLALVGPLLGAVITGDDGVAAIGLVAGLGLEHRPVGGAWSVAGGLAFGILVESIEAHAFRI